MPQQLVQWIPLAAVLLAASTFLIQQARSVRSQRQQTYTALEMASNEVFRFEAANAAVLRPYQARTRPRGLKSSATGEAVATALVFQTLNLFEIAVRMRRRGEVEPDVFGSWVVWQYDLLSMWWFRENWASNRLNYTRELRAIFDGPVADFDAGASGVETRLAFFAHVGRLMGCSVVARWLEC